MIFLSAAAGVGLYKLSPSLLDIGRIFRHAADKILEQTADTMSAEPVLRGTVFDRNFNELAVSYKLYSLYVRTAEITDMQQVVRIIADVTGQDEGHLHNRLNVAKSIVNVAKHLEQSQVDMIKNARLPGLYIKPVEERFYPKHETAANLIGFTGKGIGLAGAEGAFDMLLQEGEFQTGGIEGIDFSNERVLGGAKIDLVLTADLGLQKKIEQQLKDFLAKNNATKGIALLMDPRNGAVLAWVSQPSFNPNYYWQVTGAERQSLFKENLDADLLRHLQARLAAIQKEGEAGEFLPPETVAADDFGISRDEMEHYHLGLEQNLGEKCQLPSCGPESNQDKAPGESSNVGKSPAAWASLFASQVNGGWQVEPHILAALYDHGGDRVYERTSGNNTKERIMSPTMGIRVRHDLAKAYTTAEKEMILHVDAISKIQKKDAGSEHVMQEVLLGAIPAKSPELLLLMATEQEELFPFPRNKKEKRMSLKQFGKELLGTLFTEARHKKTVSHDIAAHIPKSYDPENYDQFLISSRIDFSEKSDSGSGRVMVMPQLVGLSLRKGLQRLNEFNLQVKIQGSGQIVSQVPSPGESLQGIGECVLMLDSEI